MPVIAKPSEALLVPCAQLHTPELVTNADLIKAYGTIHNAYYICKLRQEKLAQFYRKMNSNDR